MSSAEKITVTECPADPMYLVAEITTTVGPADRMFLEEKTFATNPVARSQVAPMFLAAQTSEVDDYSFPMQRSINLWQRFDNACRVLWHRIIRDSTFSQANRGTRISE